MATVMENGWPMNKRLSPLATALSADVEHVNIRNYNRGAMELARLGKREQLKVSCFA